MAFSGAQLFYLDPSKLNNTTTASIDRIDVYFKSKPQATNNKSGISNPGVQLFLSTTANSVPQIPDTGLSSLRWSRREWQDVQIADDASLATTFRFDPPVPFATATNVAFILQFDGDEDFIPWFDVSGDNLLSSNAISTGVPSTSGVGPYYSFISSVPNSGSNNTSNSTMVVSGTASALAIYANASYTAASWTPKIGTYLKFNAYVARYAVNGNTSLTSFVNTSSPANSQIFNSVTTTTNANGEVIFSMPQDRYEYLFYDRINSSVTNLSAGERVFPILPEFPAGVATKITFQCTIGANTITSSASLANTFSISSAQPNYIVIKSGNGLGAGADIVNVRQITGILSNTQFAIDVPLTFSNTAATFWIAPVATIDQFKSARIFGNTQDMVICKDSSANASVLFNPMQVNSITITANGTGYSNTDYVIIKGHSFVTAKHLHAWNGSANLVTNGNGAITQVLLNNTGSGFWNIANLTYSIANSVGSNSVGTSANLTFTVGTNIKGEFLGFDGKGGNFANISPRSIDIGRVLPAVLVSTPSGTFYNASIHYPYYSVDDVTVPGGRVVYCDADNFWDVLAIQTGNIHYPFEFSKRRTLPSWSEELYVPYANGSSSQGLGGTSNGNVRALSSNASVVTFTAVSNNDFVSPTVVPVGSKITYSRYVINNDYTGENTNYGNAWARGIEAKFNLASNTLAEDLLVYATCYKPANTNVLCFAKIYNTQDNDSFDTKDWTMLEVKAGANSISSPTNVNDVYEITWGFPKYPNVAFQCTGAATTTNGSQTITGAGTNFSNLVSGDLILIQNGLFPNSYMVAVANVVTNSTLMTINSPVSNLNLVGSGFTVSKLGYKYQAFNNYLNDNVARYYSSTLTENDGFNTAQIKLVMLSANGLIVPLINDVRCTAVSA